MFLQNAVSSNPWRGVFFLNRGEHWFWGRFFEFRAITSANVLTTKRIFAYNKYAGLWFSWLERNFDMVKVGGSSPLSPTNN